MVCAASSMSGTLGIAADSSSMRAIWPNKSTGTTAFVRDVTAAAACPIAMLNVDASMSTNTGVAPTL